tara:strand:+ start:193 stop:681 length:489 start_codon:yes stop_codon:yes gene_type:complete
MKQIIEEFVTVVLIVISIGLFSGYQYGIKDESKYSPNITAVAPELRPLVNEYINTLESNNIRLPLGCDLVLIDFSLSLPRNVLGMAFGMEIDNVTVVSINAYQWLDLTPNQKKLLIFHELSHDIFNLYHFSTPIMDTPMPMHVSDLDLLISIDKLINLLKLR